MATPAFDLGPQVRHVIHTVGPVWEDGAHGEAEVLASCYRRCLRLADELGVRSIAFPAIATGVYGFPAGEAARIAVSTIASTATTVRRVRLVAFDETTRDLLAAELARDSTLLAQLDTTAERADAWRRLTAVAEEFATLPHAEDDCRWVPAKERPDGVITMAIRSTANGSSAPATCWPKWARSPRPTPGWTGPHLPCPTTARCLRPTPSASPRRRYEASASATGPSARRSSKAPCKRSSPRCPPGTTITQVDSVLFRRVEDVSRDNAGMSLRPVLDPLETDRLILRHRRVGEAATYRRLWTERDLRVPPHRRINPEGRPTVEDIAAEVRRRA